MVQSTPRENSEVEWDAQAASLFQRHYSHLMFQARRKGHPELTCLTWDVAWLVQTGIAVYVFCTENSSCVIWYVLCTLLYAHYCSAARITIDRC